MVHVIASGNGDAHLKNWSLRYADRRAARLAPAYDLVPTVLWPDLDSSLHLTLDGDPRFDSVDAASFRRLGGVYGAGLAHAVDEAVTRVLDAWPTVAPLFTRAQVARLQAHRDRVPLLRGRA